MTEDHDTTWREAKERARWRRESTFGQRRFYSGRRQLEIWGLLTLLAVFVWALSSQGLPTTAAIAMIVGWLAYAIHFSFTAVLHEVRAILDELYELNDQITGFQRNFAQVIHEPDEDDVIT